MYQFQIGSDMDGTSGSDIDVPLKHNKEYIKTFLKKVYKTMNFTKDVKFLKP